jgi:hypothetical protein
MKMFEMKSSKAVIIIHLRLRVGSGLSSNLLFAFTTGTSE